MMRYLLIMLVLVLLSPAYLPGGYAQDKNKGATLRVVDRDGKPVAGAVVWYNEGAAFLKTNQAGVFVLDLDMAGSQLRIEAEGFDAKLTPVDSLANGAKAIVLNKPAIQSGDYNTINVPFGKLEKRRIVGAADVLRPDELLKYDLNQNVLGAITGRVAGVYDSRNIRGLGNAIVVIDGIPRSTDSGTDRLNMADNLNLLEVEEITVLKDATAAMLYGAKAGQGVILITTKRGAPFKRQLKVYTEAGINTPISYPKYLGAADYMNLYNEALANDGLAPKYAAADIQNTRSGINPVRYPDESFYNSNYLRNNSQFLKAVTEASGGNEKTQYFASLGLNLNGSLYQPQGGKSSSSDRVNFRGNVDYSINKWLSASVDAVAIYDANRFPNGYAGNSYAGDFFQFAATQLPNSFPTLIPVSQVNNPSLVKSAVLINGQYLLGGTSQFNNNILGNLANGGIQSTQEKSIQFNSGFNFDLNHVLKGLTAKVNFTYDILNAYTLRQENTYAVYEPSYVMSSKGADSLVVTPYGANVKRDDQTINGDYFQRRYGLYGTVNYRQVFQQDHQLDVTALAYMSAYTIGATATTSFVSSKDQHFALRANYMYKDKYVAEFSGAYVGSSYLSPANRYAFSPSAGLAWIASEEPFLKKSTLVNYLKLKASYGIIHTDDALSAYRLYNTSYAIGANYAYNNASGNGNTVTQFGVTGNPNLDFVQNNTLNIGFETAVAGSKIWLEANYFNIRSIGEPVIRSTTYTAYLGGFIPTENYDEDQTTGAEAAINYTGGKNKFKYTIGFNLVYAVPRSIKKSEIKYASDYQYRQGKVSDAMFGLVAEGLFKDAADISSHAVQSFGAVQPGDIKYKDLNGDGIINDNDQQQIGNSAPRFQYGVNLNLKYSRFELFAIGVAQSGSDIYYNNSYYWVFGDRKYSEEVLNRWTPATAATATYPRLTTTSGSNNFRNSTFWLYTNNYFTLNRAQLTYHLPDRYFWKGLELYARGNNLFTISGTRDKRELNIASSPQLRSYMLGLVASF